MINLMHGDCLELMRDIPDASVDFVLTDPPYGTTACAWDTIIPFDTMWQQIQRVIKKNGGIALFGSEPFSSALRMSNIKWYKYDWIWQKEKGVGFQIAKYRPMMSTENISIFGKSAITYMPIMSKRVKPLKYNLPSIMSKSNPLAHYNVAKVIATEKYPDSTLQFNTERGQHPTQKPVALLEYLIRTYTRAGETVLDFTMGSGSTGVACVNTGRNFIGIEMNDGYFQIAKNRIETAEKNKQAQPELIPHDDIFQESPPTLF